MRRFGISLVLALGLGLFVGCQNETGAGASNSAISNAKKPPANVGFINISLEPINFNQELSGRVAPFLISEVRPQITGIILERKFVEGAKVQKGQSLYSIDASVYNAALKSTSAARLQAQANLEAAKIKLSRFEELIKINGISQQELDEARTNAKVANANLVLQSANLDAAKINIRYTNVAAPITGRIGKSNYTKGALVTANQGEPMAIIQDISQVYVDITQSSSDILRLKKQFAVGALNAPTSADVKLVLSDGSNFDYTGKLQFSDLTVDSATGNVTLRALFPNPQGVLLPGMYVRALVSKGSVNNGISIPQSAVLIDGVGNAFVFLVGEGDKAHKQQVTLGEMIDDKWQIISGLKAGDKLIVQGGAKLKDGAALKPKAIENLPQPSLIKGN